VEEVEEEEVGEVEDSIKEEDKWIWVLPHSLCPMEHMFIAHKIVL
jgi:hypothetical protein